MCNKISVIAKIAVSSLLCVCYSCTTSKQVKSMEEGVSWNSSPCHDNFSGNCDSLFIETLRCIEIDTVTYDESRRIKYVKLKAVSAECSANSYCSESVLFSFLPYKCVRSMGKLQFFNLLSEINYKEFDLTIYPEAVPFRMEIGEDFYGRSIKVMSVDSIDHLFSFISRSH